MRRLEEIVSGLPETERVDVESWDGEPTFRVRGKVFVFAAPDAASISVKLPREEAQALAATDPAVTPTGYGLGRHGWVTVNLHEVRGASMEELVRSSYLMVAPKRLAKQVEP
jgi:predicted DNA-binding protein (MmcQ/YjbR family)